MQSMRIGAVGVASIRMSDHSARLGQAYSGQYQHNHDRDALGARSIAAASGAWYYGIMDS